MGIEAPWRVEDVELNLQQGEVVVRVAHDGGALTCPECGRPANRYDTRQRRWRHLDTCQYRTILAWGAGRLVAVGNEGVVYSDGGISWTKPSDTSTGQLAFPWDLDRRRLHGTGWSHEPRVSNIVHSDDGDRWELQATIDALGRMAVRYCLERQALRGPSRATRSCER